MKRIALVTCDAVPALFGEEQQLPALFAARGVQARAVSWSDPKAEWEGFDLVVLRSTWDYFERFPAFDAWLTRMGQARVRLQNPLELVRWNIDKRYLRALRERGVRIVPTRFIDAGARVQLHELLEQEGWTQAVLKPAVSGNAYRTVRIAPGQAAQHQQALEEILASGAALVQPFVEEVLTQGEHSLFFFAGAFSHAVQKIPAAGDFRVQEAYGSSVRAVSPEPELVATAQAIVEKLPQRPLYVRIDGVRTREGFALMEVEAIEPYLFSSDAPGALERYVDAVVAAATG